MRGNRIIRPCISQRVRQELVVVHRLLTGDVAARLADARDDLVGNPALEGFGLGLAAAQDERVQAGFADDRHLLFATKGAD